jgi:hypothetical protein
MADLPIACTLTAEQLRKGRDGLLPGLVAEVEEVRALADGAAMRFAPTPEILSKIAAVVSAERQCCRFLRFRLTAEPDLGPVWLEITGPPGTAEFLTSLAKS